MRQSPFSNRTNSSGQSLIEAVVALGITVLILITLVSGVVTALHNVQIARNKTLATKYAQEGIEATRSIRDQGWTFLENGPHGLLWIGVQYVFSGSSEVIDNFTRTVTISDHSGCGSPCEIKDIVVAVSWHEGNGDKNVTLTTILTKLN